MCRHSPGSYTARAHTRLHDSAKSTAATAAAAVRLRLRGRRERRLAELPLLHWQVRALHRLELLQQLLRLLRRRRAQRGSAGRGELWRRWTRALRSLLSAGCRALRLHRGQRVWHSNAGGLLRGAGGLQRWGHTGHSRGRMRARLW